MGYGFDNYLQSLREQRQSEEENSARTRVLMAEAASSLVNGGIALYNTVQANKELNRKAKEAYISVGSPGVMQSQSPTDIKAQAIKNRLDAIKAGVDKTFSWDKTNSQDLDKKVQDYNSQINDLNSQLTKIDDYKRTPQYQDEKINAGLKAFMGVPDNREKLLTEYTKQHEEAQYQKQKSRRMEEEKESLQIRSQYQPQKQTTQDKPTTKYSEMIQKRIDALNSDVTLSDDKKKYMMDTLNKGLENVSLAPDSVTAGRGFENTLKELNSYKEPTAPEVQKKESRREKKIRLQKEADDKYNRLLDKFSK